MTTVSCHKFLQSKQLTGLLVEAGVAEAGATTGRGRQVCAAGAGVRRIENSIHSQGLHHGNPKLVCIRFFRFA